MSEQILIVGAGAVGCTFAAYLLAKEYAVTVWDVDMTRERPLTSRRLHGVQAAVVDRWPVDTPLPDIVVHAYGRENVSSLPNETALTYCGTPLALVSRFPKARHVSLSSQTPHGLRSFLELTRDRLVNNASSNLVVRIPEVHGLLWPTTGLVDRAIHEAAVLSSKAAVHSIWAAELVPMLETLMLDSAYQGRWRVQGVTLRAETLCKLSNVTYIQADSISPWSDSHVDNVSEKDVVFSKQTLNDVSLFVRTQRNARLRTA